MSALVAFFSITYVFTWACWLTAAAIANGPASWLRIPLLYLGTFAPSIVAIALTARSSGKPGVGALLRRLFIVEVPLRWYAFAFGFWASIKVVAAVLARLATGHWPQFFGDAWYVMIGATIFSTVIGGQAGEEIGWRGYALPRMAERMGLAKASVLLGVIWETWHLPLFYIPWADTAGQSFPVAVIVVTALSVGIAFLYYKSGGSLLLTMLMHSAINNTAPIVPAASPPMANPLSFHASTVGWMSAIVAWIVAGYLLTRMPKKLA